MVSYLTLLIITALAAGLSLPNLDIESFAFVCSVCLKGLLLALNFRLKDIIFFDVRVCFLPVNVPG